MKNNENYALGLLNLTYLLIRADTEISEKEMNYLDQIKVKEGISAEDFTAFTKSLIGKSEREIYQNGMDLINSCTDDLKLKIFVRLYQMAQADGVMHVKEVRLLLYAVKLADVDINMVVELAKQDSL